MGTLSTPPRLKAPETVRANEVFTVKSVVAHPMESGQRKDENGLLIPRRIIHRLRVLFAGTEVLSADWHPGISANPYWEFSLKVEHSGPLVVEWYDDDGSRYQAEAHITVVS